MLTNISNKFNKDQYEQHASEYLDSNKDGGIGGGSVENRIKSVMSVLPAGRCILEIGSGGGQDALALSKHYKVIASDFVNSFVKTLQKQGLKAINFDAKNDDIPENVDAIYANAVFVHFSQEEIEKLLTNAKTKLHNERIVFITVLKGEGSERSARGRGFERDFCYYNLEKLEEIAKKIGYVIIKSDDINDKWLQVIYKAM